MSPIPNDRRTRNFTSGPYSSTFIVQTVIGYFNRRGSSHFLPTHVSEPKPPSISTSHRDVVLVVSFDDVGQVGLTLWCYRMRNLEEVTRPLLSATCIHYAMQHVHRRLMQIYPRHIRIGVQTEDACV